MAVAALFTASSTVASPDLIQVTIAFDVASTEIIPGVATVRASCHIIASGEPLSLRADETRLTTVGAEPGPCSIVLGVFGADLDLPVFDATPIGRNVFFLPGVATATLGLVDVSVDLLTSLESEIRVRDASAGTVEPDNHTWTAWGAKRMRVRATDEVGSIVATDLVTTFSYRMSLGLTVYAVNYAVFQTDLTAIGTFPGAPDLRTPLTVDLRPPPPSLQGPQDLTAEAATFAWAEDLPEDIARLELWLTDGSLTTIYPIDDPSMGSVRVPVRPDTEYRVWLVAIDGSNQSSASPAIAFLTPSAGGVTARGGDGVVWGIVAIIVAVALVVFLLVRIVRFRD